MPVSVLRDPRVKLPAINRLGLSRMRQIVVAVGKVCQGAIDESVPGVALVDAQTMLAEVR
jgi:hypothetical protein